MAGGVACGALGLARAVGLPRFRGAHDSIGFGNRAGAGKLTGSPRIPRTFCNLTLFLEIFHVWTRERLKLNFEPGRHPDSGRPCKLTGSPCIPPYFLQFDPFSWKYFTFGPVSDLNSILDPHDTMTHGAAP